MEHRQKPSRSNDPPNKEAVTYVPPGAPAWVTEALIQDTLDTWQSHFEKTLTPEDALEMLIDATNLMEFLLE
jgi:hypothetical protein